MLRPIAIALAVLWLAWFLLGLFVLTPWITVAVGAIVAAIAHRMNQPLVRNLFALLSIVSLVVVPFYGGPWLEPQ